MLRPCQPTRCSFSCRESGVRRDSRRCASKDGRHGCAKVERNVVDCRNWSRRHRDVVSESSSPVRALVSPSLSPHTLSTSLTRREFNLLQPRARADCVPPPPSDRPRSWSPAHFSPCLVSRVTPRRTLYSHTMKFSASFIALLAASGYLQGESPLFHAIHTSSNVGDTVSSRQSR